MKKLPISQIIEESHALTNAKVKDNLDIVSEGYIAIHLDDILKERGMTQLELAAKTGLRVGTISNFKNGNFMTLNPLQLLNMMVALKLTDLSQLVTFRLPDDVVSDFERLSE